MAKLRFGNGEHGRAYEGATPERSARERAPGQVVRTRLISSGRRPQRTSRSSISIWLLVAGGVLVSCRSTESPVPEGDTSDVGAAGGAGGASQPAGGGAGASAFDPTGAAGETGTTTPDSGSAAGGSGAPGGRGGDALGGAGGLPSIGGTGGAAGASARFEASQGNDPLFRPVDGAVSPNADVSTLEARRAAYALLL
ncbi:MAG TPA: hypothetical protein VIU64_18580, partial [Polyangia bacterium]